MGEKFTDGSIIQHLSKMRIRREAEGKPCPPPLRRSNTPAVRTNGALSSTNRRMTLRKKVREEEDDNGEDDEGGGEDINSDESEEETPQSTAMKEPNSRIQQKPRAKKGKATQRKPKRSTRASRSKRVPRRTVGGIRPVRPSSPVPTEDDDASSNSNFTGDSDDRLCVGYPFLDLSGANGGNSDEDRSPETELTKNQRVADKPRKIVRFKLPAEALRNLRDTGKVNGRSDSPQTTMAPEQEIPGHDQRSASSMEVDADSEQMMSETEDLTIPPFNMANVDYSQGGMTGPGPVYPPHAMAPGHISIPANWDPLAAREYGSPYEQQQSGEELLLEYIDPRVLTSGSGPYDRVPNWIGPDPDPFGEPHFERAEEPGPGWS